MEEDNRAEVLKQISAIQNNGGINGTASVTVQIGGVSESTGIVEDDSLYLIDAPAKIVSELSDMGFSLSVEEEGVRIQDYKR